MLGDLGRVPLAAVLAREDAPGVDPGAAPGQPLGDLSLAPGVEHGEGELVQGDDPSAGVALGLAGLDRPAELDELLGDGQRTCRAVEVGPAHAAGFPAARAAVGE